MIKHTRIAMAFSLAFLASTACVSINATAQPAARDRQRQSDESPPPDARNALADSGPV
jgi:hypothetical protein